MARLLVLLTTGLYRPIRLPGFNTAQHRPVMAYSAFWSETIPCRNEILGGYVDAQLPAWHCNGNVAHAHFHIVFNDNVQAMVNPVDKDDAAVWRWWPNYDKVFVKLGPATYGAKRCNVARNQEGLEKLGEPWLPASQGLVDEAEVLIDRGYGPFLGQKIEELVGHYQKRQTVRQSADPDEAAAKLPDNPFRQRVVLLYKGALQLADVRKRLVPEIWVLDEIAERQHPGWKIGRREGLVFRGHTPWNVFGWVRKTEG